jgi:hypothetical protein
MKFLTSLALLVLGTVSAHAQAICTTPGDNGRSFMNTNGVTFTCIVVNGVPTLYQIGNEGWQKYNITFIANGTADCVTSAGCISVNNGPSVPTTASLTQTISLFNSFDVYIQAVRVSQVTACSGATTIKLTGVGDSLASATQYVSGATYSLKSAASTTNFSFLTIANNFSTTLGADTVNATITTTGTDVNTVAAGCSFNVKILWSSMP